MNRKVFYLLPLLASLVLFGCGGKQEDTAVKEEKKIPLVKVDDVKPQRFEEKFRVTAVVKPYASAKLSSEEGGLITSISKDKGSRVSRGEVVIRLKKDTDAANLEQAETQYDLALYNYETAKNLYEQGVSTRQQYELAERQLNIAESSVDVLRTRLSKSYITSPISGVIDDKLMNVGEMSSPGSPILSVVDISRVKITAGVPERFLTTITRGQNVRITFDMLPGEEFTGKINFISPVLSETNRTFEVEVVISNSNGLIKPEMSANLEFIRSSIENAVVLQQDQIVDFGEEKYVFVLEGDIAKRRTVTLGGRNGNSVLIESGLNPGDKLIIEGFQSIADGDKVQAAG